MRYSAVHEVTVRYPTVQKGTVRYPVLHGVTVRYPAVHGVPVRHPAVQQQLASTSLGPRTIKGKLTGPGRKAHTKQCVYQNARGRHFKIHKHIEKKLETLFYPVFFFKKRKEVIKLN